MQYEIEEYVAADGSCPYAEWLGTLKDVVAQARLLARVDRAAHGNFGDWKALADTGGVHEMRDDYGPGYRVYYSIVGRKIILLLAGSTKRDQDRIIKKAAKYLSDFRTRTKK